MIFRKDPKEKALDDFEKAEQLFKALQYKKAGKYYNSAGDGFYEIGKHVRAEESFFKAAQSYINEEKHRETLIMLRKAANSSLNLEKYDYAQTLFKKAIEYLDEIKKSGDNDFYYMLFSFLSYLCAFIKGAPVTGLNIVKKIQKKVDQDYFKENPLIHFITNLTIANRDKKAIYVEKNLQDFNKLKLNEVEKRLAKKVLVLSEIQTRLTPNIEFDQEEYTTKELIAVKISLDGTSYNDIISKSFYEYTPELFELSNFKIDLSDNLAIQTKPNFPLTLSSDAIVEQEFIFKPHFQVENCYIGPIRIECTLDRKFICFIENRNKFSVNLVAPPTYLDVSIDSLKTPLIGKTFPLEITVKNNSSGEAQNLSLKVILPEELKLIRGTIEKQIYSIRLNENIQWEINLRPTEAGDFKIKVQLEFMDPDQQIKEEIQEFEISVNL